MRENALKKSGPVSLDDLFNQISEGELKELKLIVKADVKGSLEALTQSLEKLNDNEDIETYDWLADSLFCFSFCR